MNSKAVFFYEVFAEEQNSLRAHLPPDWKFYFTSASVQESGHSSPPCAVISTRTQSIIPVAWGAHLSAILSRSAGFDHLARFKHESKSTTILGHLHQYSGRAVAEHAAMLWLALLKKLPQQMHAMSNFNRDQLTGRECCGKTVAVFGVGDIGHHVAAIARGLGMPVVGVDIVHRHPDVTYVTKHEALDKADILVSAMNLTGDNHHYFDLAALRRCSRRPLFINVARGELCASSTLLEALECDALRGAGLDVYAHESVIAVALRNNEAVDHPEFEAFKKLQARPDVIMTPHNAFNSEEAVDRKSEQTVRQLEHFFTHGTFLAYDNPESLS
jgi:D-lactate dehydrogenase